MSRLSKQRAGLTDAKRVVVKIGTRSLVGETAPAGGRFASMAAQLNELREQGRSIVLVSSGAVALGWARLGFKKKPKTIALLQASAASGQSQLMRKWDDAFATFGVTVAQVLLTHADLADRDRYLNARAALDSLLALGAVPVINENDTVAVDEIRFGDNDQLAAMVASLVGADLLVLLTDVDGLLDREGKRVATVCDLAEAQELVRPPGDDMGLGGMGSKLDAARRATRRGVPVVIGDARNPDVLRQVVEGRDVGTLMLADGARLASRKHWIAYTLKPKGTILVDRGAARALVDAKKSLLPAGVVGVRGDFEPGDAVRLTGPEGDELGRGLARYGTREVARLAGARTADIAGRLGYYGGDEIVHRDDLVLD